MKSIISKRIFAYLIDALLIIIVSSMFARINILNPNIESYDKVNEEFTTYLKEHKTELFSNDEISTNFSYNISYEGRYLSLISIVITSLYFILFQFFNKGQTIGKKLMKIRIVNQEDESPSLISIIIRSFIINSILCNIILVSAVFFVTKNTYIGLSTYVQMFDMVIVTLAIIMLLFRKDGRTIHDLITNTKVILDEQINDSKKIEKEK